MFYHQPVLLKEVVEYLNPQPGQNFIDATLGNGGHSKAILEKIGPGGKLLAIDFDKQAIQRAKQKLGRFLPQIVFVQDNFVNLEKIVSRYFKNIPVQGILFDLGFSLDQIKQSGRGFTFQQDEPLDMRYAPERQKITTADLVNFESKEKLIKIFQEFGEEHFAERIADRIIQFRKKNKIKTTLQLAEIVKSVYPKRLSYRIHPATKIFQALRIAVNNELNNLVQVLPQAAKILQPKGRIAVISFHSLEDRVVKHFFRNETRLKVITKKPIKATEKEIFNNSRSRSAKLRVAEKIID